MRINSLCFTLLVILSINHKIFSQESKERPNIIFILSDDQRDNSFSGMGHQWVKTPNIDKLLKKSTRFKNAYIAEPTCTPSRATFLNGVRERLNRVGFSTTHSHNKNQWENSYPAMLKNAGYHLGFFGKSSHRRTMYKSSDFDVYGGVKGHGPFFFVNDSNKTTNRYHTDHALKYLEEVPDSKPFCLSISFATPHGSKVKSMHRDLRVPASTNPLLKDHPIYGGEHGGMYRNIDIKYPQQNPENPYDYIPKEIMDHSKGRNSIYNYDYRPDTNKEHHYRYYQMITEIDQMVGEILEKLEEKNISKNTIIIYASDHGIMMGEYGMGGKAMLYDLSTKIPCFIYDPRAPKKTHGNVRGEIVSSIDITSTILDYAGLDNAEFMIGKSLKPLVQTKNKDDKWRSELFLENLYTGRDTPLQEGIVTKEWKYIRFFKAPHPYSDEHIRTENMTPAFEMLFNLINDPSEKINLTKSKEHEKILNKLRALCIEKVKIHNKRRDAYYDAYIKKD